jgi:hypothetical protein
MILLSCQRLGSNEVRLWLSVIAYNLANLWRCLVLPKRIDNWLLTSLQQRLLKPAIGWWNMPGIIGCFWRRVI